MPVPLAGGGNDLLGYQGITLNVAMHRPGKSAEEHISPGLETTTGGTLFGPASLGARILTQVVAPMTAQNSVALTRDTRATLAQRSQNRSSSAR